MTDLQHDVQSVLALNKRMHADIVEFLKEHDNFICTDNAESTRDTLYAYVTEDYEQTKEYPILAVALFEDEQVAILPDFSNGYETIIGVANSDLLYDKLYRDNWRTIFGGLVLQNATLCSICECIEEYV